MRGLKRLSVIRLLLDVQFWFPVWLFLLLDRGFTLNQAALADALFRVVVVLAEVPMGILSDRIGRKKSLVAVCVLTVGVFLGIGIVDDKIWLFVLWGAWGVQWALASGLDTTYAWELAEQGDSGKGHRYLGITRAITATASLVSLLTAGWFYHIKPGLPFVLTAMLALVSLVISVGVPDTHVPSVTPQVPSPHLGQELRHERRPVIVMGIISGFVLLVGWSPQILMQPLVVEAGATADASGVVFAIAAAGMGVGGLLATRLMAKGTVVVSVAMGAMVAACLSIPWFTDAAGAGWLALYMSLPMLAIAHGLAKTVTDLWLAKSVPRQRLATVLSIVSMASGLLMAVARPLLLVLSGRWGAAGAFAAWGVFSLVALLSVVWLSAKFLRGTDVDVGFDPPASLT